MLLVRIRLGRSQLHAGLNGMAAIVMLSDDSGGVMTTRLAILQLGLQDRVISMAEKTANRITA